MIESIVYFGIGYFIGWCFNHKKKVKEFLINLANKIDG